MANFSAENCESRSSHSGFGAPRKTGTAKGVVKVDIPFFVELSDTVGVGHWFLSKDVLRKRGADGTETDLEKTRNSNCRAGFHAKRGLL